ncbi:MAG: PilZ domain-containing protein [Pseudomonadota bacterium]
MPGKGMDQRLHTRIPVNLPVHISNTDSGIHGPRERELFRLWNDRCVNMSLGGVFVRTTDPIPRASEVSIEIDLPAYRSFQAIGRVVWEKSLVFNHSKGTYAGLGLEFLTIPEEHLGPLKRFIEGQMPR